MKILLKVGMPVEPFNTLVREGKADEIMGRILEDIKPEAAYFTEMNGKRTGLFVLEMNNSSEIPKYAEPFFLNFNAEIELMVAMEPEDLKMAGLKELGEKWG